MTEPTLKIIDVNHALLPLIQVQALELWVKLDPLLTIAGQSSLDEAGQNAAEQACRDVAFLLNKNLMNARPDFDEKATYKMGDFFINELGVTHPDLPSKPLSVYKNTWTAAGPNQPQNQIEQTLVGLYQKGLWVALLQHIQTPSQIQGVWKSLYWLDLLHRPGKEHMQGQNLMGLATSLMGLALWGEKTSAWGVFEQSFAPPRPSFPNYFANWSGLSHTPPHIQPIHLQALQTLSAADVSDKALTLMVHAFENHVALCARKGPAAKMALHRMGDELLDRVVQKIHHCIAQSKDPEALIDLGSAPKRWEGLMGVLGKTLFAVTKTLSAPPFDQDQKAIAQKRHDVFNLLTSADAQLVWLTRPNHPHPDDAKLAQTETLLQLKSICDTLSPWYENGFAAPAAPDLVGIKTDTLAQLKKIEADLVSKQTPSTHVFWWTDRITRDLVDVFGYVSLLRSTPAQQNTYLEQHRDPRFLFELANSKLLHDGALFASLKSLGQDLKKIDLVRDLDPDRRKDLATALDACINLFGPQKTLLCFDLDTKKQLLWHCLQTQGATVKNADLIAQHIPSKDVLDVVDRITRERLQSTPQILALYQARDLEAAVQSSSTQSGLKPPGKGLKKM